MWTRLLGSLTKLRGMLMLLLQLFQRILPSKASPPNRVKTPVRKSRKVATAKPQKGKARS